MAADLPPTEVEFTLRRGVKFHDGQPFDADDVVATFAAHREPTLSACGGGIFALIAEVVKVDEYTVRVRTAVPDAMLIQRMFFAQIYPRGILEREGRDFFATHPVGTGAYRLASYVRGRELVLERNPDHWAGVATVDRLRLPILRQKEWVDRLARGELDVAWNLDSHDCIRAERLPGVIGASREAAISQWFLLAN